MRRTVGEATTAIMKQDYCHPKLFLGSVTKLYRNLGRPPDGKGVRFQDVTLSSGLGRIE